MAKKLNPEDPLSNHRERMKEEFLLNGIEGMSEHRALELLLFFSIPRMDVAGIARDLIFTFGSFPNVMKASYENLQKVKGIGPNSALLLKLVPSMIAYFGMKDADAQVVIKNADQAAKYLKPYFLTATNEQLVIMCLDGSHNLLGIRCVGEGSFLSVGVNLRRIVQEALTLNAVYLYLAHNHVTGPITPSQADWTVTSEVIEVLHPLDIYLQDHLIVSNEETASLRWIAKKQRLPMAWSD